MNKKRYMALGIFCILISSLGFALMQLFVRLAGDLPSVQKTFFRNLIATGVALIPVLKNRQRGVALKGSRWLLLLRSIFGTVGIVLNFFAVEHLSLSDASILQKLSPFVVIILSLIFLKEVVKPYQWAAVVLAFIGAIFVIKPGGETFISVGALAGLCGAVMAGSAYTCLRALSLRGIRGEFIIFFFSAFSCISLLPFVILQFQPMSGMQMIYLLLVGLAATMGQFGITFAYAFAPASRISVFEYSQIVFAALLGFTVLSQVPDIYSIIGYVIIISVGIFMMLRGAKD
ncbi:MAG: DMT family transporter [Eubacteriales bacterium]|nr:DMT family transporter [Eubacteriales bacterium]